MQAWLNSTCHKMPHPTENRQDLLNDQRVLHGKIQLPSEDLNDLRKSAVEAVKNSLRSARREATNVTEKSAW